MKRLFCFSDIHANLPALIAVYNHALVHKQFDQANGDHVLIPGDLINYGGSPGAVIDFVSSAFKDPDIVLGNHEQYAQDLMNSITVHGLGEDDEDPMSGGALLQGLKTTVELLTDSQKKFVERVTARSKMIGGSIRLSHSRSDSLEEYVFPNSDVSDILPKTPDINYVMGHSHVAAVFVHQTNGDIWNYNPDTEWDAQFGDDWRSNDEVTKIKVCIKEAVNFLLVCPSVGKPRADGCRKAGYAIVDLEEKCVNLYRVPYDDEQAAKNIIDNGMPEVFTKHLRLAV